MPASSFFFFQAEDGIRDIGVTGVQTCALPIWPCKMIAPVLDQIATEHDGKLKVLKLNVDENPSMMQKFGIRGIPTMILRSEERRVGKECRSRWSPYH